VKVRKAVIPAAGLGTRFLPATKSIPKEMIPVVDKPGIQYAVEEAVRAGIRDVLIITSRGKQSLEDHFDRAPDLERELANSGKNKELEDVRSIAAMADVHFVRQQEPLGLGHAVSLARPHVGSEAFVVMLPDEIVPRPTSGERDLVGSLVEIFEEKDASVVAVRTVPREDVSNYGIVDHDKMEGNVARVRGLVEKPSVDEAPSELSLPGRYLFSGEIFEALDKTKPGHGGEIQLTDAIDLLATEGEVYAYLHEGPIYDVGKKLEYLKASIEMALRDEDLSKPLKDFLMERSRSLD
jgi:UTP--glucose-1-phosphate uridylyltransferase